MKSALLIPSVDATSPPTFTCAPLANRMPFGFTRNILPLAVKLPRIEDGSGPNTRFNETELLLGCWKVTASFGAMLKLCQLIAAFWLDWLTVSVLLVLEMLASPATTDPLVGSA